MTCVNSVRDVEQQTGTMYSSINVPPHLLRNDDGTLPDNPEQERERVIREKKKKYEGLDSSELKERSQVLNEEIEELEFARRRLKNAIHFYEMAWHTAKRRADRHGEESPIAETLSGDQSEDGWTIKRATEWPDSGGGSSGGGKPHAVQWEPSDAEVENEGVRPDDLEQRLDLRYDLSKTWNGVLRDIDKYLKVEEQHVERISRQLSEAEFCRSVIDEKLSQLARGDVEPDESPEKIDAGSHDQNPEPKEKNSEELIRKITQTNERMRFINGDLRAYGEKTWKEAFREYERIRERLEIGDDYKYKNAESMKAAYYQWQGKR